MTGGPPSWQPPREILELAELVLGAVLPGFPVRVRLPPALAEWAGAAGAVTLEDAEGAPVATLTGDGISPLGPFTHGPLRSHRRTPEQLGPVPEGRPRPVVPVTGPLTRGRVDAVAARAGFPADGGGAGARSPGGEPIGVLWLVVVGARRRGELSPHGLFRAVRGAAADLNALGIPGRVVVAAVPVLAGIDDDDLVAGVCRGFGATEVVLPHRLARRAADHDVWHPASARELRRERRRPNRRGVTVFFTGLSGSGKSTIARGLVERLREDGRRSVSLLDGDEVRQLLSRGLGFSRADRDLNIRRIGLVAAEVTRHGGVAVCAPIAPFSAVRQEVRERVEQVGDFILVHVSTPVDECERRDRKGLYARARQGLLPDFTGVSSPYEVPEAADLRIDTTNLSEEETVDRVWRALLARGYLGTAVRFPGGTSWTPR